MNKTLTCCLLLIFFSAATASGQFRKRVQPEMTKTTTLAESDTTDPFDVTSFHCGTGLKKFVVHSGTITDEQLNPVPFATVKIPETDIGTVADSLGRYSIRIPMFAPTKLEFSAVGYNTKTLDRSDKSYSRENKVVLEAVDTLYSSVEVISPRCIRCRTGCGIWCKVTCSKTTVIEPKQEDARINIYPNPAPKGTSLSIRTEGTGPVSITMIDNQGKTHLVNNKNMAAKSQVHQLQLPASAAAGLYYLVFTEADSDKQYTQKLIIQ